MCSIFRYPLVVYLVSLISKSDLFLIFFSTHLTTKQKALRTCLQGLAIGFQLRVWRWVKECCLLGHFTIASTSPWKLPLGGFQGENYKNDQTCKCGFICLSHWNSNWCREISCWQSEVSQSEVIVMQHQPLSCWRKPLLTMCGCG